MRRYLPALLVMVSAGILVAGLLELNTRQDEGLLDLGIGDDEPSTLATPSPTPAETLPLSPSPDDVTGAQETPAATVQPTPTSAADGGEDVGGATGAQARGEPMPVTGGGAVTGGLLVLGLSAAARALSTLRLR